jgi:hypothetical protein
VEVQLRAFFTSALDGGERSATHSGHIAHGERALGTHWIGGIGSWVVLGNCKNNNASTVRKSRDSSVGIALGYELDDRGSRVSFPAGDGNFSPHHRVQNGSGAHPASYPMGTRGSFPAGEAAGA